MDTARADLLERLAAGPARIAAVAQSGDGETGPASSAATAGAWSARENVAHLVLVERQVFQARLADLAAGGTPSWGWTEPGTTDDPGLDTLGGALAAFATVRGETIARVAALDDAGWSRFGQHATYGRLDVAGLLEVIVDHDDHHRGDIAALYHEGADR